MPLPAGEPGPLAQTNLQLYAQLRQDGWPASEIEAVARAYRWAAELLAGWYRPSGKPFIDHFVGTASAAAATGARPEVVRAALVHNAYGGVIGADLSSRVIRARRRDLREVVGADAEELAWAYSCFAWDDEVVSALRERAPRLTPSERDLTVLRLANEVDDRLDLGLLHGHQERLDDEPMIALADAIDEPVLAAALRGLATEEAGAQLEPGVRGPERVSYRLVPPTAPRGRQARKRIELQARRVARRVRWELRRAGR